MKYSVIMKTARKYGHFKDLFDSYANEMKRYDEDFEMIIVDTFLEYEGEKRREEFKKLINGRFEYIHTIQKPSNWTGLHKKTRVNFFDGAGAVNTGLIVCNGGEDDYVLLIDDCVVFCPGYFEWFIYASKNNMSAGAGAMWVKDLVVDNGIPISFELDWSLGSGEIDPRLPFIDGSGLNKGMLSRFDSHEVGGGGFIGNSSGIYFQYCLELNGWDEYTARWGADDSDTGYRLDLLSKIKGDNGIQRFPMARSVEDQARNNFERHMFRDQEYHFRQYITEGKEKLFWPEGLKETDDIDAKIKEMIIPEEHYFPIREFVHNQWESDERRNLCLSIQEKWQELYDKHSRDDSQEGSGLHDGNWIRLDHMPFEWSKFDLVAARELYRSTGEFPEPNFIDKCPFSGIPLEEL